MLNNREAGLYFSLGYISPNGMFYSAYIQFAAASVSFTQGEVQIHCGTDFTSYPATALQQFEMNTPASHMHPSATQLSKPVAWKGGVSRKPAHSLALTVQAHIHKSF